MRGTGRNHLVITGPIILDNRRQPLKFLPLCNFFSQGRHEVAIFVKVETDKVGSVRFQIKILFKLDCASGFFYEVSFDAFFFAYRKIMIFLKIAT